TLIAYQGELPKGFDAEEIRRVYNYRFDLLQVENTDAIPQFDGSIIYLEKQETLNPKALSSSIDFYIQILPHLGSILLVNGEQNKKYIAEIQHVRRRETIAMTPSDCYAALNI